MANATILKEFLMSVGFKVDEPGLRKLQANIAKVSSIMESLGAATTAVAILIDENVVAMAESFDKLYYASQRIGTSVKSLQTLQFASQMIGVSADSATSGLEGLARAIRLNPGLTGYLNNLGVATKGRDMASIQLDLYTRLAKMQPYIAAQIGQMFGQDPDTLNLYLKNLPRLTAAEKERQEMYKNSGLDPDKLATQSADFERDMLRMNTQIEILRSLIAQRFMPAIEFLVNGLTAVVGFLSRADKATGGASTYGLGAGAVGLGAVGAYAGKNWLMKLVGRLRGPGAAAGEGAAGGEAVAGVEAGGGVVAADAAAAVLVPIIVAVLAALGIAGILKWSGALDKLEAEGEAHPLGATVKGWLSDASKGVQDGAHAVANAIGNVWGHNPGNLRSWGNALIANRGRSGNFATFGSDFDGLSAESGQLLRYDARGINTIRGIVSKWAPKKENNTGAYISDIAKKLGIGPDQHLNLHDPAVMTALMAAMIHHEQGRDPYSMSAIRSAADFRLGKDAHRSIHIQQNNEIVVHGGGDAAGTGRAVAREQRGVGNDLVRHAVGAAF